MSSNKRQRTVDVIILTNTADKSFHDLTKQAVDTLRKSEVDIFFDIKIIESNKSSGFKYEGCEVVVPDGEFHYNRFLNEGLKHCSNEWIACCNNDLIFHEGWMSEMLRFAGENPCVKSMSPIDPECDQDAKKFPYWQEAFIGYGVGEGNALKGHCFVLHRSLIEKLGLFDEAFDFYGQDDDYGLSLKNNGETHCLITASKVTHLGKRSHKLFGEWLKSKVSGKRKQVLDKWRKK